MVSNEILFVVCVSVDLMIWSCLRRVSGGVMVQENASVLLRNYANLNNTFRSELALPSQEHKNARSPDDPTEYG